MSDYIDDLIVIDQDEFYKHKVEDTLKHLPKVAALFDLECFNETSMKMIQSTFKQRPHPTGRFVNQGGGGGYHGNIHPHAYFRPQPVKPQRLVKKASENSSEKMIRDITSNLNKISNSNQSVITEYIYNLIKSHQDNIRDVVNIIFVKCVTNPTYVNILLCLIDRLSEFYPADIQYCIEEFITNNVDNLEGRINTLGDADYENYDEFCKFMKTKNEIITGFKIVMIYIDADNEAAPSLDLLFEKLMNMLTNFDVPVFLQNAIVQLVQVFFELTTEPNPYILQTFSDIYNSHKDALTLKSKFIFEDILKKHELIAKNKSKPTLFVVSRRTAANASNANASTGTAAPVKSIK